MLFPAASTVPSRCDRAGVLAIVAIVAIATAGAAGCAQEARDATIAQLDVDVRLDLGEGGAGVEILRVTAVAEGTRRPRQRNPIAETLHYRFVDDSGDILASGWTSDPRLVRHEAYVDGKIEGEIVDRGFGVARLRLPSHAGELELRAETEIGAELLGSARIEPPSPGMTMQALTHEPPIFFPPVLVGGSGDDDAMNIVILAEGYTADEFPQFRDSVDQMVEEFFSLSDYSYYRERINIWRVDVISKESGIDEPAEDIWRDTAFGLSFGGGVPGVSSRVSLRANKESEERLRGFVSLEPIAAVGGDQFVVFANTDDWDARTWAFGGFIGMTASAGQGWILGHELGHGVFGLGDEYIIDSVVGALRCEKMFQHSLRAPNLTPIASQPKWADLVLPDTPLPTPDVYGAWTSDRPGGESVVGAFVGGGYCLRGLFRPQLNCMMRRGDEMCGVCRSEMDRFFEARRAGCGLELRGDGVCDECLGDDPDCDCESAKYNNGVCDECLGGDPDCDPCPVTLRGDGPCDECLGDDPDCEPCVQDGSCNPKCGDDPDCCPESYFYDGYCDECLGDDGDCNCPPERQYDGGCDWSWSNQDYESCGGALFDREMSIGAGETAVLNGVPVAIELTGVGSTLSEPAARMRIDDLGMVVRQHEISESAGGWLVKVASVTSTGNDASSSARICVLDPIGPEECEGALFRGRLYQTYQTEPPEARETVTVTDGSATATIQLEYLAWQLDHRPVGFFRVDGERVHIPVGLTTPSSEGLQITLVATNIVGDPEEVWGEICVTPPPEAFLLCGDGTCNGFETCATCAVDCGNCPLLCGDGTCAGGAETCTTCPSDCGACPVSCGDGTCTGGAETCTTCPSDCGACPPTCDGALSDSVMSLDDTDSVEVAGASLSYTLVDVDLNSPLVLLRVSVDADPSYLTTMSAGEVDGTANGFEMYVASVNSQDSNARICTHRP